ncbi:MAG TPA: hypothetical protein VFD17_07195 [Clostridia bacterium]|nr:hypothetical protein [Clostridia bacterium]
MPRKHKNAQRKPWRRRTRAQPNVRIVILPLCKKLDDGMSPGRLVAVAEYRKIG